MEYRIRPSRRLHPHSVSEMELMRDEAASRIGSSGCQKTTELREAGGGVTNWNGS